MKRITGTTGKAGLVRTALVVMGALGLGRAIALAGGRQEQEPPEAEPAGEPDPALEQTPLDESDPGGPAISGLTTGEGALRTGERELVKHHGPDELRSNMMSGGPPPDGIPSIDEPQFLEAEEADLDPGDKVVGLAHNGAVRAYPHAILVVHEIVNHEVGGENLAITYCPLTATAQGYKTGSTTLGVSGRLINSNLVMYDRDTGSLWPQISATAIAGEREGETLDEVELFWTTWERWRSLHPETEVLSTDTGHVRDYGRDPYGSVQSDWRILRGRLSHVQPYGGGRSASP